MEETVKETPEDVNNNSNVRDYREGRHLTLKDVFNLFFNPAKLFGDEVALGKAYYLIVILFVVGFAQHFRWVDSNLLQAAQDSDRAMVDLIVTLSLKWTHILGTALFFAPVSSAAMWYLGGWWYKMRLEWCCERKNSALFEEDTFSFNARTLYTYSFFVVALPSFLYVFLSIPLYGNYLALYVNESLLPLLFLIFPFWSVFVSYRGVTAAFPQSESNKTKLWFLILPTIFYCITVYIMTATYFELRSLL